MNHKHHETPFETMFFFGGGGGEDSLRNCIISGAARFALFSIDHPYPTSAAAFTITYTQSVLRRARSIGKSPRSFGPFLRRSGGGPALGSRPRFLRSCRVMTWKSRFRSRPETREPDRLVFFFVFVSFRFGFSFACKTRKISTGTLTLRLLRR
jgi:hypothetical protein